MIPRSVWKHKQPQPREKPVLEGAVVSGLVGENQVAHTVLLPLAIPIPDVQGPVFVLVAAVLLHSWKTCSQDIIRLLGSIYLSFQIFTK